jgi:hypothetical protein
LDESGELKGEVLMAMGTRRSEAETGIREIVALSRVTRVHFGDFIIMPS